jgi:hypothetical protein
MKRDTDPKHVTIYEVSRQLIQAFKKYYGYYLGNLRGCSVGSWEGFLKYAVDMASGGMTYM